MTPSLNGAVMPSGDTNGRWGQAAIWSAVLEACTRSWRTQTWLVQKLELDPVTVSGALIFLAGAGLLEQRSYAEAAETEYLTSSKGEEVLAQYYLLFVRYLTGQKQTYSPK